MHVPLAPAEVRTYLRGQRRFVQAAILDVPEAPSHGRGVAFFRARHLLSLHEALEQVVLDADVGTIADWIRLLEALAPSTGDFDNSYGIFVEEAVGHLQAQRSLERRWLDSGLSSGRLTLCNIAIGLIEEGAARMPLQTTYDAMLERAMNDIDRSAVRSTTDEPG